MPRPGRSQTVHLPASPGSHPADPDAAEERRQRLRRRLLFTTSAVIPVAVLAAVHLFWVKIDLVFARTWQLLKP